MKKENRSFGVGCFHFASQRIAEELTQEVYVADLKTFFLSDKLISNLEIIADEAIIIADNTPDALTADISESEDIYPFVQKLLIRFDIHVPRRVQEDYVHPWRERFSQEDFTVEIDYSHSPPVTFVWSRENDNPSAIVSVLWKHFGGSSSSNEPIKFQMIGPSPFHADFQVHRTQSKELTAELIKKRGYDDVTITIPDKMEDDHISEVVRYRFCEELSIFYWIEINQRKLYREFIAIRADIEAASEYEGAIERIWKRIVPDRSIYDLAIKLERYILDVEGFIEAAKERIRYFERGFGDIIIEEAIDRKIEEIRSIPVSRYSNIVLLLRENLNNRRTNYAVVTAALLGALAALLVDKF